MFAVSFHSSIDMNSANLPSYKCMVSPIPVTCQTTNKEFKLIVSLANEETRAQTWLKSSLNEDTSIS